MAVQGNSISGAACAILSLTTRLAWTPDMPQPLPRKVVRRMLNTCALEGLVLRDTPQIEEKWFERSYALLGRVADVYEGIEAYHEAGYRLLLPGDAFWPSALRVLGDEEPLFLFVKGNELGLGAKKISVAGSRRILLETQKAAAQTGRLVAADGNMLVTGGAEGVDSAALRAALEAGGSAAIVPAVPALRLMENRMIRRSLERGQMILLCDTLPDEPFSAAKALSRNHTIYALGEASLVVAARDGRGGSWRGATACLLGGFSPVYVWNGNNADTAGNRALEKLGAQAYGLDEPLNAQLTALHAQTSLFDRA